MRKPNNNKYRNNNYNQSYSLNYKFDSNSIHGKISGTALDLIKKYNELAKDAQQNSDYVAAETFRQYAEHYRKIVTEVNEKRNQNNNGNSNGTSNRRDNRQDNNNSSPVIDTVDELIAAPITEVAAVEEPKAKRKEFQIIEVSSKEDNAANDSEASPKPKRNYRRKSAAAE